LLTSIRISRDLLLLGAAVFGLSFALGIQTATFMNFLVEDIGIEAYQLGVLESIREVPGFLSVFLVGLGAQIAESSLAGVSLLLFSLGIGSYYTIYSLPSLVFGSFLWSLGLHCWMPLRSSLVLNLSEAGTQGRRLGQMGSVASLATMIAIASVFAVATYLPMNYRVMFLAAALVTLTGAVASFLIRKGGGKIHRPRLIFRREYGLYYLLELLEGSRKQIFITFAVFALVKVYGTSVSHIAILMLVNSLIGLLLSPSIGKLNDRIGEKRMLTISYLSLVAVFLGYAFIHQVEVLYALYCLDSLLFIFSGIALITYLNKIAASDHLTSSLAMGTTMNHVASVTIPLLGGLIWSTVGYETTFLAGAIVVLASLTIAQRVKR